MKHRGKVIILYLVYNMDIDTKINGILMKNSQQSQINELVIQNEKVKLIKSTSTYIARAKQKDGNVYKVIGYREI
ncbi:hypothetical protein [Vallitalea guaymasensis]|uniref:hypothetical protein n=1 Tax=Vallitalea guaymasensis TaxID=1185412 RepID=UPI000DE3E909|nr:hypothetical protein [Vallitalea guaymasensis]